MQKHTMMKNIFVVVIFLIAAAVCVFLSEGVAINYNLSDYLDEDTQTKISLEIIENEFGTTCDVQVMIDGITAEDANSVRDSLSELPNVLNVSFDAESENNFRDNKALFVVLVEGDEYSDAAIETANEIRTLLSETYADKISLGGAVIEKSDMRSTIQSEMLLIIVISVALAAVIMLLTSHSWLEPVVLLATSGIAILLNMGTNLIFGEISYITNAVAAILQLALSIDYSIVLLHSYRSIKETEENAAKAMSRAVKSVFKPVSASALTTLAGLLALLFMSFGIGFDIGSVLMKGIILSALVSMTLLPSVLLLLDGAMTKTAKKALVLRGRRFCDLAFTASAVIVPLAVVLIVGGAFLQAKNTYAFTDTDMGNSAIKDTFGQNNSIVLVYDKDGDTDAKEAALIELIKAYQTESGKNVLKSYNAYSNTVREIYDLETAAKKLDMSVEDVELLFVMYHLYADVNTVKLSPVAFVTYAHQLSEQDESISDIMDADTKKLIELLLTSTLR